MHQKQNIFISNTVCCHLVVCLVLDWYQKENPLSLLLIFFQGSEAGMLLYVVRRHCSACFQWVLKSRASSSFIPFWASLDSVFVILLMLPAQQCCGSAVLPCCEASVQLSQPLFPALKLWLPMCLLDEATFLSFSVGTDTLGSSFDPECVIQTSEFRSVKQD